MKKPELLAPAGSYEKAKTAYMYGADSVYMGTSKLSLRSRVEVENDDLVKTIRYAHNIRKKVYVALNIYARDDMFDEVKRQAKLLEDIEADGVIISDGGVLEIVKQVAPKLELHISTQANTVSLETCKFWYKNGAKRIILARELSKNEIEYIMNKKPKDLEIEMFVHGAICYSYSGRCHLSDFLANRGANLGDCAQSCRWSYNMYIEERNKPGNLMPVIEDNNGTYILSSKDICLIKEIPEIINMGLDSLKIEGRLKTEYYLATIINVYRTAIDDYIDNPGKFDYMKYIEEIQKTKTRGLTTFFFKDKENKDFQEYEGKQYNSNYEFGGKIIKYEKDKSIIEIRNKLVVGDILELIIPGKCNAEKFKIKKLWDAYNDNEINHINPGKLGQKVKLNIPIEAKEGWILRREK